MRWLINTVSIIAWLWGTDLAAFMVSLSSLSKGSTPCRLRCHSRYGDTFSSDLGASGSVFDSSLPKAQLRWRSAAQVEGLMMKTVFNAR
jgi:hypothetical protein